MTEEKDVLTVNYFSCGVFYNYGLKHYTNTY